MLDHLAGTEDDRFEWLLHQPDWYGRLFGQPPVHPLQQSATADEMAERFVGMLDTLVGLKFTNHATSPALHARLLKSVDAPRAWAEWRGQGELLLRDGASALLLSATAAESEEMWAGLHVGALAQEVVESVRLAVAALMPAPSSSQQSLAVNATLRPGAGRSKRPSNGPPMKRS